MIVEVSVRLNDLGFHKVRILGPLSSGLISGSILQFIVIVTFLKRRHNKLKFNA